MITDEFVDKYDLVVDGCGKGIRLSKESVLGIVFDRADECGLLWW